MMLYLRRMALLVNGGRFSSSGYISVDSLEDGALAIKKYHISQTAVLGSDCMHIGYGRLHAKF